MSDKTRSWVDRLAAAEVPAFTARRARMKSERGASYDPLVWKKAKGSYVWDLDDRRYLDLTSSFGAALRGHAPPESLRVLSEDQQLLTGLGDLHPSQAKIELLEALKILAPIPDARVALGVSGSDALTIAMKSAMLSTKKHGFLAMKGSYHGLAFGPLALSHYRDGFRQPFEKNSDQLRFLSWTPETLKSELSQVNPNNIAAIIVEPIRGRGGISFFDADLQEIVFDYCDKHGLVIIADEILCGLGRAGQSFVSKSWSQPPDLVAIGKSLGGGLPISACLGSSAVMNAWGHPNQEAIHTSTFSAHPLACRSALAFLNKMDDTLRCVTAIEAMLRDQLLARLELQPVGQGAMLALELGAGKGLEITSCLRDKGILTLAAGLNAEQLQLLPATTFSEDNVDEFVTALGAVL